MHILPLLSALFFILPNCVVCQNDTPSQDIAVKNFGDGKHVSHGKNCSSRACAWPFKCTGDICLYEQCGVTGCRLGTYCDHNNICAAIQCTANHSCPEYFKCYVQACIPCSTCEFCGNEGCACRRDSHCNEWRTCDDSFCSADKPAPAPSILPFASTPAPTPTEKNRTALIVSVSIGAFVAVCIMGTVLWFIFRR